MLTTGVIIAIGSLGLLTLAAITCAGINPLVTLRETFVPLTRREFWLPPCPFCWAARAAAVVCIGIIAVNFVGQL